MENNQIRKEFSDELLMKYEIAEELGLLEKVKCVGWGGLTAKETGRIGGLMTVRRKKEAKQAQNS